MILYGKDLTKIQYELYGSDCWDCANSSCAKNQNTGNIIENITSNEDITKNVEIEIEFVGCEISYGNPFICNDFEYDTTDENLKKNFKIEISLNQFEQLCEDAKNAGHHGNIDDELREFIKRTHDIPDFDYEE